MKNNKFKKGLACVMSLFCSLSMAACGGGHGDKVVDDGKTINVRVFKGGYGADWVYELADNFEKAYANEGYRVNILKPASDMRGSVALSEIAQGVGSTGVDLYITGNVDPEMVGVNNEYSQNKALVEDVEEIVLNQKPISYDGTEENVTIKEKLNSEILPYLKDSTDTYYAVPYINTAAGFVVNTRKLATYGLDLPKTTNELLDCFSKIYLGFNGVENSEKSGVFPITYVPGVENGYSVCWLVTMLAQYDLEEFYQFMSMETVDEQGVATAMREDGYKVFGYQGIEEMLTVAYAGFDPNIAAYGTTTQVLDQAQAQIMKDGGAVFMCNGDWMLNEVKLNYKKYLNDIEFINFPVVSALGTKLFGNGTSYNLSDDKCDELLSYIIGLVDEQKTIDEIVSAVKTNKQVTIAAADAQEIAAARGVYYNRGTEHEAYITKDSPNKDIAALFLRMLASDDCAATIAEYANASSSYAKTENTWTQYKFTKQASKVTTSQYAVVVRGENSGFRKSLQISPLFTSVSHIPSKIAQQAFSIYDGKGGLIAGKTYADYRTQAIAMQNTEKTKAEQSWTTWVK